MTIDEALKIVTEYRDGEPVSASKETWMAYGEIVAWALRQGRSIDSRSRMGEYCVTLVDYALNKNIVFSEKVIPYCKRHVRDLDDVKLLRCVMRIRQQPNSRCQELEQYGWLEFLDFLESEQLRRNGGE